MRNTNFLESETVIRALEFALAKGGFGSNARQKKAAQSIIRGMNSPTSVSGKRRQITALLKKGATLNQMIKATHASRRTIFRYLNHFEDAGIELTLVNGKYRLAK